MARIIRNEGIYAIGIVAVILSLVLNTKLNSYLIAALFLFFLLEGEWRDKIHRLQHSRLFLVILLYFIFLFGQLVFDPKAAEALKIIETKASLLIIPMIFIGKGLVFSPKLKERISSSFVLAMLGILFFCLFSSFQIYLQTAEWSVFFYHELSKPLQTGAIYLSLFALMALLNVFYERLFNPIVRGLILLSLFLFLLLLASKTLLLVLVVLLIVIAAKRRKSKLGIVLSAGLLLFISLILSTSNPIQDRFADLDSDRLVYLWQDDLQEDIYLDGMSMRLLFARFGMEIISENGRWIQGIGQGERQTALNQKIVQYHLYQGGGETNNTGYLGYNFHNQYMEEWVGGGLTGLLLFSAVFLLFARNVQVDVLGRQLIFVFAILFLTESVLLRQYGVVAFSLFLCLQIRPKIEDDEIELMPDQALDAFTS